MKPKRHRYLVNPWLQIRLCIRASCYWVGSLIIVSAFLIWNVPVAEDQTFFGHVLPTFWLQNRAMLIVSFLCVPFIWFDCLYATHALVGPLSRLRAGMKQLARGGLVPVIKFRKGDQLAGMDHDFNLIAERLRATQRPAASAPEPEATPTTASA